MSTVLIVAIVFASILTLAALVCGTVIMIVKMGSTGFSKSSRQSRSEESKMIQEIYEGLARMEQRVESLETILMDTQEKDRDK
jgi:uncharacterized membrane protein